MCELLGISAQRPIRPNIIFKGFKQRGEIHPNGWGIGCYPDRSSQIFKEPLQSNESSLARFLADDHIMASTLFIAHVRRNSSGNVSHRNTHPFERELEGRSYIMAHNGTVYRTGELQSERFQPIGETDSEVLFCHLMSWMDDNTFISANPTLLYALQEHLQMINRLRSQNGRPSKLNCLISDGDTLICYADLYHSALHWLKRPQGYHYQGEMLSDEDYDISFEVEKGMDQTVHIVATKPMTHESGWRRFDPGEMRVYKNGALLFSHSMFNETVVESVEVYQAPRWLSDGRDGNTRKIGLPQTLRKQLNVEIGERVLVENEERSLYLTVCKTDRKLLHGPSKARNPEKHALIPKIVRHSLKLRQFDFRENVPHFKTQYLGVAIKKI